MAVLLLSNPSNWEEVRCFRATFSKKYTYQVNIRIIVGLSCVSFLLLALHFIPLPFQPSFILFVSLYSFLLFFNIQIHTLVGHCLKGLCKFNELFCVSFCFHCHREASNSNFKIKCWALLFRGLCRLVGQLISCSSQRSVSWALRMELMSSGVPPEAKLQNN